MQGWVRGTCIKSSDLSPSPSLLVRLIVPSSCRPKRLDRLVGTRSTVTNETFNADFLKQQKIVKLQPIIAVNGIKYWGMSQPVSALIKRSIYNPNEAVASRLIFV